jgi:hypothetical protein
MKRSIHQKQALHGVNPLATNDEDSRAQKGRKTYDESRNHSSRQSVTE